MDCKTQEQRSYNMSRIRSKNTKPEIIVRKGLWKNGYRYRLHRKDLPGKPDIVFPALKKVVFINGCFWHRHSCEYFKWPKTNIDFWRNKINDTVERDQKNYEELKRLGWDYMVLWECEIKKSGHASWKLLEDFLENTPNLFS